MSEHRPLLLRVLFISCFSMFAARAALAGGPKPAWSDWERANSLAQEGNWLVIRQPGEGFCYIQQDFEGARDKMGLSMKRDARPYLTTPFFRGIEGDVTYQVDNKPMRLVLEKDASALGIKLSPDVVPEMQHGTLLKVRVKHRGQPVLEQRFELRGFAAAVLWLDRSACKKASRTTP